VIEPNQTDQGQALLNKSGLSARPPQTRDKDALTEKGWSAF